MITLSRKLNQSVMVGENLELKVRKITSDACRIQITSKDVLSLSIGATFADSVSVKARGAQELSLNQTIHVSEDISFTVAGIQKGEVRIGVKSPAGVPIQRGEVYSELRRMAKR